MSKRKEIDESFEKAMPIELTGIISDYAVPLIRVLPKPVISTGHFFHEHSKVAFVAGNTDFALLRCATCREEWCFDFEQRLFDFDRQWTKDVKLDSFPVARDDLKSLYKFPFSYEYHYEEFNVQWDVIPTRTNVLLILRSEAMGDVGYLHMLYKQKGIGPA